MILRLPLLRSSLVALTMLCAALMGTTFCLLSCGGGGTITEMKDLPTGDVTTFEVASTLREAGRHDEAILVYFEAIQADSTSEVAAQAMEEVGGIYIELQRYDQALAIYERLLNRFPMYERAEEIRRRIEFVHKAEQVIAERRRVAEEAPTLDSKN